MTGPGDFFDNDAALGAFLRRHDPVLPPSAETLAMLEERIIAKAATQPRPVRVAGTGWWLPGVVEQPWAMRSAGLLAVLVLLLGFAAGQGLGAESDAAADVFAASAGTPWQSFITTASLGDTDDATDDAADDGK
jgi:hypothetical protein